jgi:ribosomal protein S21
MTEVSVKGNLDGALKRFKVKVSRDGIPSEIKKRKFYSKPGIIKREEKKQNIINSKKKSKRDN